MKHHQVSWLNSLLICIACCFLPPLLSGSHAAEEYLGDGVLDARNEEVRWHVNRTRFAPEREADRLGLVNSRPGSNGQYDVAEDADGIDDFTSTDEFNGYVWADWALSRAPFAPNAKLSAAAAKHSLDLAETQTFQHSSPSSQYFAAGSAPHERHASEGYQNVGYGFTENLLSSGIGYSDDYPDESIGPQEAHEALFIDVGIADRGHRKTILNFVCTEIGLGHHQDRRIRNFSGFDYFFSTDYYTYDLGLRTGQHFFTGSILHDANANELYDRGEGVGGIEIRLIQGGVEHTLFDVSNPSGSFAIPLAGLTVGETVAVELINQGAAPQTVSVPVTYDKLGGVTLAAGERIRLGSFTQPSTISNVGFRELIPEMNLAINCAVEHVAISFRALVGLTYEVQSATDLVMQNWETVEVVTATSNIVTVECTLENEPLPVGGSFRVVWLKDQN